MGLFDDNTNVKIIVHLKTYNRFEKLRQREEQDENTLLNDLIDAYCSLNDLEHI